MTLKVVLFGGGPVAAAIADFLASAGAELVGLGLAPDAEAGRALGDAVGRVAAGPVLAGADAVAPAAAGVLAAVAPDLGVCAGFPLRLPEAVLAVPARGWVNLHPSYLPYNRGAAALEWAIVDRSPAGVSLHVVDGGMNTGPLIARRQLPVGTTDDRGSLQPRVERAMVELFAAEWPRLRAGRVDAVPQDDDLATAHTDADARALARLDPDEIMSVRRLLDVLRAHTGGRGLRAEVVIDGTRYEVATSIVPLVMQAARRGGPGESRGWSGDPNSGNMPSRS